MNDNNSSDNRKKNTTPGLLDGLPPVIEDPVEFQQMVDSLPEEKRKFAELATRFAKLWEYLESKNLPLPLDVVTAMRELPSLPTGERLEQLENINARLLELETDAGKDTQFRQ
jgi:hypothetical protein